MDLILLGQDRMTVLQCQLLGQELFCQREAD